MAASQATSAFGTLFLLDGAVIAETTTIAPHELSRAMIDVTSHGSDDSYEEFIPGLKAPGEVSITANFIAGDTNGQTAIRTAYEAGTLENCILVIPSTASWEISGRVSSYKLTTPLTEQQGFESIIKVSGRPGLYTTSSGNATGIAIEDNAANAITLSPTFAGGTYEYSGTALTGATGIKVTPTAALADDIWVQGEVVASGAQSSIITLPAAGETILIYVVVKEDTKIPVVYRVNITRAST